MFLPFLFAACVELPSAEIKYQSNISQDVLFEDWSEDWAPLEEDWSQDQLTKEERSKLRSELEILYFDRIVPHKKQLHELAASQLLGVELAFGRLLYDIEHRRGRKISAKTAKDRRQEMTQLKQDAHQLLALLSPSTLEEGAAKESVPLEHVSLETAPTAPAQDISVAKD